MQSLQAELLSMRDKTCRLALFDNSISVVRNSQVGVWERKEEQYGIL